MKAKLDCHARHARSRREDAPVCHEPCAHRAMAALTGLYGDATAARCQRCFQIHAGERFLCFLQAHWLAPLHSQGAQKGVIPPKCVLARCSFRNMQAKDGNR
eukprot:3724275-Amphidinium_carterae.1